jgi:hypothetical protein
VSEIATNECKVWCGEFDEERRKIQGYFLLRRKSRWRGLQRPGIESVHLACPKYVHGVNGSQEIHIASRESALSVIF